MRTRAYRPEVSGRLEGRSLLSGVAGLSAAPYVFRGGQFKLYVVHANADFTYFARYRDPIQIRHEFEDIIPLIPFARADGLPAKFDGIVDQMVSDVHAGVPHAIRSAYDELIAATKAEVEARVQAGDVVIR
jgi:hypothetical protein